MLKTAAPWIVVTGLDGSGKTGLVRRLAQRFGAHFFACHITNLSRKACAARATVRSSAMSTPIG